MVWRRVTEPRMLPFMKWMLLLPSLAVLCACATSEPEPQWSQLLQVENRFSVYLHHPGEPSEGDFVRLRLVYVYGDGEIEWQGEEVAWQEYPEMLIDCASNHVALGRRVRYAPDGREVFSDDKPELKLIAPGTLTEIAAAARCEGKFPADTHSISDGPDWMGLARQHLSAWVETRSI